MWLATISTSDHIFANRLETDKQRTQRRRHPQTRCLTTRVAYSITKEVTLGEDKFW